MNYQYRLMTTHALPRVFIADPSPVIIDRLIGTIIDVAHVVGHATDARAALAGVREHNPQLAVLDIGLHHGLDLLRQINQHRPPVMVAVLTHNADDTTRRYCLRLGAAYFLDKLNEFEKVREIVIANGGGPPPTHRLQGN